MNEFNTKLNRIRDYCSDHQYDGMYLSSRANFAWLTCGGNSTVERCSQYGVAGTLVFPDKCHVIASENRTRTGSVTKSSHAPVLRTGDFPVGNDA